MPLPVMSQDDNESRNIEPSTDKTGIFTTECTGIVNNAWNAYSFRRRWPGLLSLRVTRERAGPGLWGWQALNDRSGELLAVKMVAARPEAAAAEDLRLALALSHPNIVRSGPGRGRVSNIRLKGVMSDRTRIKIWRFPSRVNQINQGVNGHTTRAPTHSSKTRTQHIRDRDLGLTRNPIRSDTAATQFGVEHVRPDHQGGRAPLGPGPARAAPLLTAHPSPDRPAAPARTARTRSGCGGAGAAATTQRLGR